MTTTPSGDEEERVDVLVTGSAGFVGSAVVERLVEMGLDVRGVDLRAGTRPTLHLDVTDGGEVMDVFKRLKPRKVVHAAAYVDDRGSPENFQRVNVGGTQNVLDAAAVTGVERLIHLSSIAAMGFDPGENADETNDLVFDTGSPYFDTKAASEQLVRTAIDEGHVPAAIVRPGDVYGPGSEQWVERPLGMMKSRMPVLIDGGRGLIAHTWIGNLVDGIVLAMEHPNALGRTFIVTDGVDTTTYRDYFTQLAQAAGLDPPSASMPRMLATTLARGFELYQRVTGGRPPFTRGAVNYVCRRSTYSIDEARRILDYRPKVDLESGMAQLAEILGPRERAARDLA